MAEAANEEAVDQVTPPATNQLVAALAKVQGNLPKIKKTKKAAYGMYADLDSIHEAILPLLSAEGLAWVTRPAVDQAGDPILKYSLIHTSGEQISDIIPLYVDAKNSQKLGAAITYAKRYAISAVVGITTDDDDDGQSAGNAPAKTAAVRNVGAKPAPAATAPEAAAPNVVTAAQAKTMPATDNQKKAIFATLGDYGIKDVATQKAIIYSVGGVTSTNDLSMLQARDLLKNIKDTTAEELVKIAEDYNVAMAAEVTGGEVVNDDIPF